MSELHDLSALEQGEAIRSREVSSREFTEHYLERTNRLSDQVGAFARVTEELARRQADAADVAVREGGAQGPLWGVVCPVKALAMVDGVPTNFGSLAVEVTPPFDDFVVSKMREAGLVFTGLTNAPEFGLPCYTEPDPSIAPPAKTPWDLSRSAGGSSGGAGAAVAAGLAPIALGSDGGGSIRIPASVTGIVGIKPTRGRVSNGPLGDAVADLVNHGPMARTVADAAALLDALAGAFPGDPYSAIPPKRGTFLDAATRDPGKLTIGMYVTPVLVETEVDPQVLAAVADTAAVLESLGHEVVEIDPPFDTSLWPTFSALWSVLALLTPVAPEDEHKLRPLTRYLREQGRHVTGVELATALGSARVAARAAVAASAQFDAVLAPTVAALPALVGQLRDDADPEADFAAQSAFSPFCAPYNVTGQPAINVPLNWSLDELPIGVQLIGRMHDEETLISLAAALESESSWTQRQPAMW